MTKNITQGTTTALSILAVTVIFLALTIGFAWWAFSWTTHTLVWFIFIFGSLLGSVKVAK